MSIGADSRVSILILLEVVLEVIEQNLHLNTCLGFNPYFAGSSSGSCFVSKTENGGISFNPYFAGSSSGSEQPFQMSCRRLCVSILILLEVVLEDKQETDRYGREMGFNPYFAGSSSGSCIFFYYTDLLNYKYIFELYVFYFSICQRTLIWRFF